MTAVKPTAELQLIEGALLDARKAVHVLFTIFGNFKLREGAMVADEVAGNIDNALKQVAHLKTASLASHRQPESALDGARKARSVEIEELAGRIDWVFGVSQEDDPYNAEDLVAAAEALRAYAKLLRGEKP